MEQLDLKTEGEKKSVFKRFAEGAGAVQLQGPYHPPHSPREGPQHKAQHPSSAAAGVEERRAWWSQCGHSCLMAPSELKDFVPQVLFSSVGMIFHLTGML